MPNIVLYGGSGKYTRLMILLKNYFSEITDPYKTQIKAIDSVTGEFVQLPTIKNKSKNKVILAVVSKSHCEIELNQPGSDKALLPFLEYYSKSKNINLKTQKYVILKNIEFLKYKTQNALRRIIETSQTKIRFMVTVNVLSNLINPLISRFLCINVKYLSKDDAIKIIKDISQKENFKICNKKINSIIEKSYCGSHNYINLRELLLILEGSVILSNVPSNKTISKIYITEKNEASDLLITAVKGGNREDIRNTLYKIYELIRDDFNSIITCDFFRKMLDSNIFLNDSNNNRIIKFVSLTSKWNVEINKNHILEPIYSAEAYLFSVCELIDV